MDVKEPEQIDAENAPTLEEWRANLAQQGQRDGFFEELGPDHDAYFTRGDGTLLVTFENLDHIFELHADRRPWGQGYAVARGWSNLGLMARDWTWYRDEHVHDFFERLRDDGFFNGFEKVVFYGASMGAYAACAFAAAVPGSTVIAISPQATLDREIAPWETRYHKVWRRNFNSRFGYAPDMVMDAGQVYLFYDPTSTLDAMHASLFRGPNITKFRCRFMGHRIASLWANMGVLKDVADACVNGDLKQARFSQLMRARRGCGRYEREFLARLQGKKKHSLVVRFCRQIVSQRRAPKFRQGLRAALKAIEASKAP